MADVRSGILGDANFLNLQELEGCEIRSDIPQLLLPDEQIIGAFRTVRDQVIFTSRRVMVVNVQGITGKKISYASYPFKRVIYYSVETAGVLDIDSELALVFEDGTRLRFDFRTSVDIRKLSAAISMYML